MLYEQACEVVKLTLSDLSMRSSDARPMLYSSVVAFLHVRFGLSLMSNR